VCHLQRLYSDLCVQWRSTFDSSRSSFPDAVTGLIRSASHLNDWITNQNYPCFIWQMVWLMKSRLPDVAGNWTRVEKFGCGHVATWVSAPIWPEVVHYEMGSSHTSSNWLGTCRWGREQPSAALCCVLRLELWTWCAFTRPYRNCIWLAHHHFIKIYYTYICGPCVRPPLMGVYCSLSCILRPIMFPQTAVQ
jgi:hypothetical protein